MGFMDNGNETSRPERLLESLESLLVKRILKVSQEMELLKNMMHMQANRAISYSINDRVTPQIQNIVCSLPP